MKCSYYGSCFTLSFVGVQNALMLRKMERRCLCVNVLSVCIFQFHNIYHLFIRTEYEYNDFKNVCFRKESLLGVLNKSVKNLLKHWAKV